MRAIDWIKILLAFGLFVIVLLLPGIVFLVGWSTIDLRTGLIGAAITFAVLLILIGVLIATIRRKSWLTASLPLLMGMVYSLLPDLFIGPVDDGATLTAGALLSFVLWIRKQPSIPKWVLLPSLGAAVYTWLGGGLLPGPLDELIVYAISGIITWQGLRHPQVQEPGARPPDDFVEGEFIDLDDRK